MKENSGIGVKKFIENSSETVDYITPPASLKMFEEWSKKIFEAPKDSKLRQVVCGIHFIKSTHKNLGDEDFANFLNSVEVLCGQEVYDYIRNFTENNKHLFI